MRFTPGPWIVTWDESNYRFIVWSAGTVQRFVCRLSIDEGVAVHDGKLIAAAPELYALLKEAIKCHGGNPGDGPDNCHRPSDFERRAQSVLDKIDGRVAPTLEYAAPPNTESTNNG